jgi:diguanylate cyclase (GGDEF)-like protein
MLGGLLTLAALVVADMLINRSMTALRNLTFVLIASATCAVVSGLPEALWPAIAGRTLLLLETILVPVSAAIALNYLDNWLGGKREDLLMHRFTAWGANTLAMSAVVLTLWAAQVPSTYFNLVQGVTAGLCIAAALVSFVAATRAALLGDPLARWMVLACLFLAAFVGGLTLRALQVEGFGLGTWIVTAICTLGFFLTTATLTYVRGRQNRRLAHLASLEVGTDPATGLPTGSVLLSEVEHAFWRTGRLRGQCTVVCLHLSNLYELSETAGHGVANQILVAMAARVRRAAGFRCVVGLYHPRCFVVVISADKRQQFVNITVERLRTLIGQPLNVTGQDQTMHAFTPHVGVGVVTVDPHTADPSEVIAEAERQALAKDNQPPKMPQDFITTAY